jgi:CheY-like chemotaxis protein
MIQKQTVFLVVDDFEPMRKVTANQLRAMGANNILTANNGAEALRVLKKHRVDIVLSDWNMPVMAGLELLKTIRGDNRWARLPFIMITAEAARHRIEEAITAGVSDLLVKPYTADRLITRVEKALTARPRAGRATRPANAAVPQVAEASDAFELANAAEISIYSEALTATSKVARPTILVVDDTPDNLVLLSHLFTDEYRVRIAHSGKKALHICHSNNPPDLVLLDIMMPGMDGFEVARRMREHPTSEAIPVIFVTAMTSNDARLKGLELGAVDFVTKPIDPEVLKPRVRNFMRYVEANKQLQVAYDGMLELAHLREDVEQMTRHDLKGPLAGVIGLVQGLAQQSSMTGKQVGQLRMVEETSLKMLDMINLSAELFKIETGRFMLEARPVKIGEILHKIAEISRATFLEKHLRVAVDTDVPVGDEVPQVLGDAMLCYSLFHNLIKNACEAAPEKSLVAVALHVESSPLAISIQNHGAVPAEIRGRFFGKFVTHGNQGGTGLGAYSAKLLTEAQNGTIALEVSDWDNQTTVTVTLPRYAKAKP